VREKGVNLMPESPRTPESKQAKQPMPEPPKTPGSTAANQPEVKKVPRMVKISVPLEWRPHMRLKSLAAHRDQTIGELARKFILKGLAESHVKVTADDSPDGEDDDT
jgi:hypothetical protein